MNKRRKLALLLALLLAAMSWTNVVLAEENGGDMDEEDLIAAGYLPVSRVMTLAGYAPAGEYAYETRITENVAIAVTFDLQAGKCAKNRYLFDIQDRFLLLDGTLYLSDDALSEVLGCEVSHEGAELKLIPHSYEPGEWTRVSRLIAHAGGAVRSADYNSIYTNSLEALVENYNLGHRVFEFDFELTSDGALALVHDWKSFGWQNGKAMSAEEWKKWKAYGNPVTRGRYTTMFMEDLLDEMLVNRDMFVVTDTKSMSKSKKKITAEFEMIRDAIQARDPELFDRIIPQVYDPATYDLTMSVYPWRSVVYTTYENNLPASEIIEFAGEKDNIHVITASYSDKRFTADEIDRIHQAGVLFYSHTLNTYTDITHELGRGVDGLYSDLLVQDQLELYERAVAASEALEATEVSSPEEMFFLAPSDVSPTFEGFLQYAADLEDCALFLAVKGEAMQGLSDLALSRLKRLGIQSDLSVADGCSFCAVIENGQVVESAGYEKVSCSGALSDGTPYELSSAGEWSGDDCSIMIKEKERAANKRGFNIVVYHLQRNTVIHNGSYDTHVAN